MAHIGLADFREIVVDDLRLLPDSKWHEVLRSCGVSTDSPKTLAVVLEQLQKESVRVGSSECPVLTEFQKNRIFGADRGTSLLIAGQSYLLVKRLGSGGMAEVYLARWRKDDNTEELVALKRPVNLRTEVNVRRFERECAVVCDETIREQDGAKYVVRGINHFYDGADRYLAMEYVEGTELDDDRFCSLKFRKAMHLVDSVCKGLKFLHDNECVHRDIKPNNLIHIDRTEDRYRVMIVDLGIAKVDDGRLETVPFGPGTLRYSAPECFSKPDQVDCRSDVYSLAAVFFKLISGAAPAFELFLNRNDPEFMRDFNRWLNGGWQAPSLQSLRPETPPEISELISRSLSHDQSQRPQNISEFTDVFRAVLSDLDEAQAIQKAILPISKSLLKEISEARSGINIYKALENSWVFLNGLEKRHKQWRNVLPRKFPEGLRLPIRFEYLANVVEYNQELDLFSSRYTGCVEKARQQIIACRDDEARILEAFDGALVEFQGLLAQLLLLQHRLTRALSGLV